MEPPPGTRQGDPVASSASSASSQIAVGLASEEEELYALAGSNAAARKVAARVLTPATSENSPASSTAATGFAGSFISTRESETGEARASGTSSNQADEEDETSADRRPVDSFAFDSDMDRYPASITSSIRHHVYEGGLRYHAFRDGMYAFPNDDVEQDRDDVKHTMSVMLCRGSYFYAPVDDALKNGGEVLDLGTGTGIWAIELGDKFPNARIEGVDLSPIQPDYVPENVQFFVDDFEDEWLYEENKFDFIHVRHTIHSVKNRQALLAKAMKHLKPGGYIEFQGLLYQIQCDDESMTPDTPYAFRDFTYFLAEGLRALGSEINGIAAVPDEMRAAGFEGVNTIKHKSPIGAWPRDRRLQFCGMFMREAIMDGLPGLSARPFSQGLGWTELQVEMFLVEVRKHVMDGKFHTYFPYHIVYGMKPKAV